MRWRDGRAIRVLSVVDAYTRECLALVVDTSFASRRVTRVLEKIITRRGRPTRIRCDNGPELTSRHFLAWCVERQVECEPQGSVGSIVQFYRGSSCAVGYPANAPTIWQACMNAASSEPNGPTPVSVGSGANVVNIATGSGQLQHLGCYAMGSSVIVPPAQGTFGDMSRYELYSVGTWEWDICVAVSRFLCKRPSFFFFLSPVSFQ
jgi:Integrase core domain